MRKNTNLSKSTLIKSIQCQKSLYLYKYHYHLKDPLSREQKAKFDRGHSVGELAQDLFPGGKNVAPKSPRLFHQSVLATDYLVKQQFPVIYEAAFRNNGVLVFLDILVCKNGKWYAYEVKSSKKISATYIQDAAIQHYVIAQSGLSLEDFSIIYVNEAYDYGQEDWNIDELFLEKSVWKEVHDLAPFVQETIENAKGTLESNTIPERSMGAHCDNPYPCNFKGYCSKEIH